MSCTSENHHGMIDGWLLDAHGRSQFGFGGMAADQRRGGKAGVMGESHSHVSEHP